MIRDSVRLLRANRSYRLLWLPWGAMMDLVGLRPAVFAAATVSLLPFAAWTLGLPWMDRTEA